jgi:ABC-type sugar transport system permease subunit
MPSAKTLVSRTGALMARPRPKKLSAERLVPPLILAPSMAAIFTFVYIFILITLWVSLSRWGTLRID